MEALLPLALKLLSTVAPQLTGGAVGQAIQLLAVAVPAAITTAKDLMPIIKVSIDAIRGNPATTPEQLAELDAIEAKIDADYDAASAAAKAEDDAADAAKG